MILYANMHDDFYLRNSSDLIKRHNPLCKIACINDLHNKCRIDKRSLGKKRIANYTSVIANKYMMDISIMVRVFTQTITPLLTTPAS